MSVNIMSMVKDAVSQQVMNKIGSMVGLDQSKSASAFETAAGSIPVSYTHLTLPTILLV